MIKKRIKAYFIDLAIHLFMLVPALIFVVVTYYNFKRTHHKHELSMDYIIFYVYVLIALGLLLIKDGRQGRSFGKKKAGIMIIDKTTNRSPSFLKPVIRNYINLVFTPVDIVFLLSDRSFGDMVVNTTLAEAG
jgi:uncharacterized RDD family membrane protein YckC